MSNAFPAATSDGGSATVTINMTGSEDAPVISGVSTGSVQNEGTAVATGNLSITDPDANHNPVSFQVVAATISASGHGTSFTMVGGTWTYIPNGSHADVEALSNGEKLSD